MKTKELDFEDDSTPAISDTQLKSVAECAARFIALRDKLDKYAAWAKEKGAELRAIEEVELPDLMDACGMKKFTLTTGDVVEIKSIVAGSIPKSRLEEALQWLRDNGHSGLIKRKIEVALERGKDALGDKVIAQLKKLGVTVKTSDSVHAQTLGAWAREMIAEGETIPLDTLGIYVGRRATVSNPATKEEK